MKVIRDNGVILLKEGCCYGTLVVRHAGTTMPVRIQKA